MFNVLVEAGGEHFFTLYSQKRLEQSKIQDEGKKSFGYVTALFGGETQKESM
jgi:hypothetical protein